MTSWPQRIARNLSWLVFGEGVLKVVVLLVSVSVARAFGVKAMGTFTVAYGAASVLVLVLSLGQVEVLIREVARQPERARSLAATSLWLVRRGFWVVLPPVLLAVLGLTSGPLLWTLVALLPFTVARTLVGIDGAAFKGLDRMEVEIAARGLLFTVGLLLLFGAAAIGLAVWGAGMALSVGAVAAWGWMRRRRDRLSGEPEIQGPRDLLQEGWPFLALGALTQLLFRLDLFLLEGLGVGGEEVGLYGAASTLVWGVLVGPQVLALAIFPSLSRSRSGRSRALSAWVSAFVGLASGAALAALLAGLRSPLVGLVYGPSFAGAVEPLRILAWSLPGASVTMLLGTVLAAWGRQRWTLAFQVVAVMGSGIANFLTIPLWGLLGAAWVAVGVHSLLALGQLLAVAFLAARHRF